MYTTNAIKVEEQTGYTTDILVDVNKKYRESLHKDVDFALDNGANEVIITVTRKKGEQ